VSKAKPKCVLRWLIPNPPDADSEYDERSVTARTVEEVFTAIETAEREVFGPFGIVSAVCLDDSSDECLYVGAARERWSLYYLRMPEMGEAFARCVGDPNAPGTTEIIEECGEPIDNNTHPRKECRVVEPPA
jgi:hypothetical protein